MKIEKEHNVIINPYYIKNDEKTVRSGSGQEKKTTVYGGSLFNNLSPVEHKKKDAQQKALKVVSDAFHDDKKIDDDLAGRREHIQKLRDNIGKAQKELDTLAEHKSELMQTYGVSADSDEQKDLELLQKRNASGKPDSKVTLTEDEKSRLKEIDKKPLTEYQSRVLDLDAAGSPYEEEIGEANKQVLQESAIIRGVNLERLKSDPMADAKKQAEDIKKDASGQIIGMLMDEVKDKIDDDMDAKVEEAKEKKAEKKEQELRTKKEEEKKEDSQEIPMENMLELGQIKSDVQNEVQDIVNKMNLTIEDIKGAVVDKQA